MKQFEVLADRLLAISRLTKDEVKWREQFINKRPSQLQPILPGTKVYLVSGSACRSLMDSDAVQGMNYMRYSWVPKGEIWIDDSMPESEMFDVLLHESVEVYHMLRGEDYDHAHDKAKAKEDELRHKQLPPGELEPVTK